MRLGQCRTQKDVYEADVVRDLGDEMAVTLSGQER